MDIMIITTSHYNYRSDSFIMLSNHWFVISLTPLQQNFSSFSPVSYLSTFLLVLNCTYIFLASKCQILNLNLCRMCKTSVKRGCFLAYYQMFTVSNAFLSLYLKFQPITCPIFRISSYSILNKWLNHKIQKTLIIMCS